MYTVWLYLNFIDFHIPSPTFIYVKITQATSFAGGGWTQATRIYCYPAPSTHSPLICLYRYSALLVLFCLQLPYFTLLHLSLRTFTLLHLPLVTFSNCSSSDSDSPEFLYVALKSFSKPMLQCFICCFALRLQKNPMIMGKISIFITKWNTTQRIKHWSNVSWRNSCHTQKLQEIWAKTTKSNQIYPWFKFYLAIVLGYGNVRWVWNNGK